jgi:hypothetical protein
MRDHFQVSHHIGCVPHAAAYCHMNGLCSMESINRRHSFRSCCWPAACVGQYSLLQHTEENVATGFLTLAERRYFSEFFGKIQPFDLEATSSDWFLTNSGHGQYRSYLLDICNGSNGGSTSIDFPSVNHVEPRRYKNVAFIFISCIPRFRRFGTGRFHCVKHALSVTVNLGIIPCV